MGEALLLADFLLQAYKTIISDAAKAHSENRDPTPEEDARRQAARKFQEDVWASLAPKP